LLTLAGSALDFFGDDTGAGMPLQTDDRGRQVSNNLRVIELQAEGQGAMVDAEAVECQ
jgi:hypothetical protein